MEGGGGTCLAFDNCKFPSKALRRRDWLKDLCVGGRKIWNCILEKYDVKIRI